MKSSRSLLVLSFLALPLVLRAAAPALPSFKDVAKKIRPSVVNISIVKNVKAGPFHFQGNPLFDDFFGRYFGERRGPEQFFKSRSLGSGVIIDAAGYILTNNHVVEDADSIQVKLADKRELEAEVVGRDPKTDLAVIKVKKGAPLPPAVFGDSEAIEVGDWVLAIGSPFGLEQTVSHGIISAKGRVIGAGPYDDFLQTDAPINPGNSGGPLVNLEGEVVGINTAITTRSGGSEGVGFAIPAALARKVYRELASSGRVTRGWLGISIQDLDEGLLKYFGLPKGSEGAVVADVLEDGPAKAAGLRQGDVVLEYDGKKVSSVRELQRLVAETPVGRGARLKVWRGKAEKTLDVKVANMADFDGEQAPSAPAKGARLGAEVRDLEPAEIREKGLKEKGVLVERVEAGSPAEVGGLQAGDIVMEVDKVRVKAAAEFVRAVRQARPGDPLVVRILRGNRSLYLSVTPKPAGGPGEGRDEAR